MNGFSKKSSRELRKTLRKAGAAVNIIIYLKLNEYECQTLCYLTAKEIFAKVHSEPKIRFHLCPCAKIAVP